ncbi:MAG TPA: 3-hydroxyacyl-CoA dehydrogenase NAD-binding domain-containing protein, partial [Solirubrobacterales bacterium]|nr:3-hydroxyacyl-CoA dehydrogenase NAD-binding domain-containing protein [Solirubrobacterales bacterium]
MKVTRIGVLGAGTMGRGIAQVAALGGYETVLYDVAPELAEAGAAALREALAKGASRGRWSEEEAEAAANRVETAADLDELGGCDL